MSRNSAIDCRDCASSDAEHATSLKMKMPKKISLTPTLVVLLIGTILAPALLFADYTSVSAFQCHHLHHFSNRLPTQLHVVADDTGEPILTRAQRVLQQDAPPFDPDFDANLRSIFPRAINNCEFATRVVQALDRRGGFSASNTLLTTSLCSDELARQLADDFSAIYGNGFNLGGLAGFPFAGNMGFQTMCGHIPDGGGCLLLYGPHVGVTADGVIGKVEREGVSQDDICCRSAIEALNFVTGHANTGVADFAFTDLQQGAVQNMVAPLSDRLMASQHPMGELPFAIFDTQNELIESIVREGIGGVKERGIAILGGVQINTAPKYLDYFQPMRFDLLDNSGQLMEDLLPELLI